MSTVGHLGATPRDGGTRFEVWAPDASTVSLVLGDRDDLPMRRCADGAWDIDVDGIGHGTRYRFRIDAGDPLPDPASRWQPDGVDGPSAVVDPARFAWTDQAWDGMSLGHCVYSEIHIGTFTAGGTLADAAQELERLRDVGVTMVELMPVNAFPGERNWGYDGVFPSAVQHSYGGPEALAAFVDTAHGLGLGVTLDVVYNHLGPEGSVLDRFGPYFTDTYATPWGAALNFSEAGSDQVRRFFIESACGWIRDFHVDGLRIDAVHSIVDPTATTFIEELVRATHAAAERAGRDVVVVAESADNDPRLVRATDDGGDGFDAQWNDDFHHALRVALTGDVAGYYADYAAGSADLAEAYAHGFVLRGRHSVGRGRRHGRPLDGRPGGAALTPTSPQRLVVFAQNHDQVGNRPRGERLDVLTDAPRRRLAMAAVLLSPFTPMLFMGEEYGDPAPFPFFVDHRDPDLLDAVRRGRAQEFAGFDWAGGIPDPGAASTMAMARLEPGRRTTAEGRSLTELTTALLALRRTHPAWRGARWPDVDHDDGLIRLTYHFDDDAGRPGGLRVWLNFGAADRRVEADGRRLLGTGDDRRPTTLAPWSVLVTEVVSG